MKKNNKYIQLLQNRMVKNRTAFKKIEICLILVKYVYRIEMIVQVHRVFKIHFDFKAALTCFP